MNRVIEEWLHTPVRGEYDAVVVGAGPAGCGAALALARSGMKTLLIEQANCLGGAWTTGFMNPLFDFENKTGIVRELVSELRACGCFGGFIDKSFNYEYMKYLLENKMREAGVEVLYHTVFAKALVEEHRVYGVIAQNIEGRFAVLAKTVVDGTGDGSVAADAGCPFELGENGDFRECQAMTLMFLVGNIPEAYRDGLMLYDKLNAAYEKAGKTLPFTAPYLIPVPHAHFGVVQFTHMYEYNPLSADDRTQAVMEGRRQLIEAFACLTEYDEEFKGLELITSSGVLGVRESRRIIGEYRVTTEDVLRGARFADAIARVTFGVDMHTKENKGQTCFPVQPYDIPMRALIPKGYRGIVTVGRSISGSREAMASYRVTGDCCQMGENAGYYIAHAIRHQMALTEVRLELPLVTVP